MSDGTSEKEALAQGELRGVLPAGTTLRGYELKAILGQGAFGITYRARDTTLDRDVAVKEYLPTTLALREGRTTVMPRSPEHAEQFAWGRERFLEEARILARLDLTTAIVRVYDFLEANGTAYMVMALVEGETLAKRLLREQRLAPEAIERLLYPLLDGMEELHAASFLHRDIKPANIMVDARGRPTLIDFGASRAAMAGRSTTLTAIFTPGYAAIEQFTSTNLGPWTDIYGLAATFYHSITGRTPPSAIERMVNDTWESLADLQPPGFSPALLAGIDAALALHGEDRPRSVAEWRHMLRTGERLASQEQTRVARKPRGTARAAGRPGRAGITIRGPALWGVAAAALLLVAGGGYFAWQATTPAGVGTTTLALSTEQLEHVLAERRKADALAAEKRQLVDEARRRADAEAEAKRQTEAELEQARQARQKAEDDLAKLKADIAAQRQAESGQREQADTILRRAAEEAAQRKAEDEAEGLRLAEEEAKRRAVSETETKRLADEALVKAEAERQRAEQEARLKTEAEATAMRQASEDTQRKAMEAETRRQAEEAQAKAKADREKADAEAKAKAEADKAAAALARQKEEAESAEKGLRLEAPDRERLQVSLTSLGFDTRGNDGILGPRSREMIAAWQKARNQLVTGFLTAAQQQALLKEAAPALSKYDEQKKADEEAKARTAAASPTLSAPLPPQGEASDSRFDGKYAGGVSGGMAAGTMSAIYVGVSGGRGSGTIDARGCGVARFALTISPAGDVAGQGASCAGGLPFSLHGRVEGNRLFLVFDHAGAYRGARAEMTRADVSAASAAPASSAFALPSASPPSIASQPAITTYDGSYSGQGNTSGHTGSKSRSFVSLQMTNGRGSGTIESPGCDTSRFSVTVSQTGSVTGEGYLNCVLGTGTTTMTAGTIKIDGAYKGRDLNLIIITPRNSFSALLALGGPSSPSLPSPDGMWRGTYACTSRPIISLEMQVGNGSGSWKNPNPTSQTGLVFDIRVSLRSTEVEAVVSHIAQAGHIPSSSNRRVRLSGQYSGDAIRAVGGDEFRQVECTLALARA